MSIELINKIWFEEGQNLRSKLADLTASLDKLDFVGKEWTGITVRDHTTAKEILRKNGPLTTSELLKYADTYNDQSVYFTVDSYMKCWRFQEAKPSLEYIPFSLVLWDQKYLDYYGMDHKIEGDANFLVDQIGPFVALVNKEETEELTLVNEHVGKNLEFFQKILFQFAYSPSILMMKVFSAEGLYQPLNAHLVYFHDLSVLKKDLKLLKSLWDNGMPAYKTPPMSESGKDLDRFTFHPWRNAGLSVDLYNAIKPYLEKMEFSDQDEILDIDWDEFDNFEHQSGRIVLEYPHWVNYFVDSFYLELLHNFTSKT